MRDPSPERRAQARDLEKNFKTALELHEAGRLTEAGEFYERILAVLPRHADTLDLLGRSLLERGDLERAFEILSRAVSANPRAPSAWNHLGIVARARGDLESAVRAFQQVIDLHPDHIEGLLNLSIALGDLRRWQAALGPVERARDLGPDVFAVRLRTGVVLRNLKKYADAVVELRAASRLNPLDPEPYLHLSACHGALEDAESRGEAIRRGILAMPERHEVYTHLRAATAEAIGVDPVEWARRAVTLRPLEHLMWDHLASCCHSETRFHQVVAAARRSMMLSPGSIASYNNLATGYFHVGGYDQAIRAGLTGLMISPGFPEIEFILCQSAFCGGRAELGWRHWPARLRLDEAPARLGLPKHAWRPDLPVDGPLLICAEQGVGDEILYFSCLPDLLADAGTLIVECEPRWRAILERSFPDIITSPRQMRSDPGLGPVHDYADLTEQYGIASYVLCGTLPEFYRRDVHRDPPRGGYLAVDAKEAEIWNRRLPALGRGPYIGVCWRSGLTLTADRTMYYPDAVDLLSRLPAESATFVSLQYGELGDDLQRIQDSLGVTVHHFEDLDQRLELDRVAALMSCLDLVIAPSSTVCHLASSVGVPTIAMDKSNFMCVDERDPMFLNVYPVMRRDEPANPGLAAKRTGAAVTFFLANGYLPRVEPGNS